MLFSSFANLFLAFGLLASALLGSLVALVAVRSKITWRIAIAAAIAGDLATLVSVSVLYRFAWCSEYINDICVDHQISSFQRHVADHATFIIYASVVPASALTATFLARQRNASRTEGDSAVV